MSEFEPIDLQAARGEYDREWQWDELRVVIFPDIICELPTPESNRRAHAAFAGTDAAGWPLRDGP